MGMSLLASIPSPSSGAIDLGPLTIHMYGLTLLAAIGICIWITGTPLRQPRRRLGPDLPLRRLGRRRGHRRRAALPPRDELERGARPVVGAVRDLEGRPRRLGRDRRSAVSSAASSRSAPAPTCGSSPTASHPACSSRRRSGGSATGGTRSSSGSRPTCRGASRSTRSTGRSRRSTRRPTTRRSSTSCSGTSSPRHCSST